MLHHRSDRRAPDLHALNGHRLVDEKRGIRNQAAQFRALVHDPLVVTRHHNLVPETQFAQPRVEITNDGHIFKEERKITRVYEEVALHRNSDGAVEVVGIRQGKDSQSSPRRVFIFAGQIPLVPRSQ